jgi:hypothetical protein
MGRAFSWGSRRSIRGDRLGRFGIIHSTIIHATAPALPGGHVHRGRIHR